MGTKTTSATATQTLNKRKAPASDLAAVGRNIKRRASKALDEVQCTVPEGKRRRKSRIDSQLPSHTSPASAEEDEDLPILPIFQEVEALNSITFVADGANVNTNDQGDVFPEHEPHILKAASSFEARLHQKDQYVPVEGYLHGFGLPQYLRPMARHILNADLSYLSSRGALQIPHTGLRNELLRCYVQYVHPYLPLLDLQDSIVAIERNDGRNRISMLLFQAVMFAGTGFIDMGYLIAEGFDTRKAARRAFFQRVKLLYDFNYEVDRVTVVQAVLLMTYWYEAPDDPKDIWHWLGIAISLASTIGINNDNSRSSLDLKTQKLWKRIWWCCYLRDRLISLGMRRPLRIRDGDFSVGMLELEDFETVSLPIEQSCLLGACPAVHTSLERITLAKLCLALIDLCKCVSQVLETQYCLMGQKIGDTQNTTVRLVPKQPTGDLSDVLRCDRALEEWYLSTPPELHYFQPNAQDRANANDGEVISLHRSLLTGIYLTTISALHRPYTLAPANDVTIAPELKERSVYRIHEAANEIAKMYKDLYTRDLIRYLPNTAVSILLPALIIHFLDLDSEDATLRQASGMGFQTCMLALQRLREMYASADCAFSILDALVRRAHVNIPLASPPETRRSRDSSFSASASIDRPIMHQNSLLLTPPPEATWTAKKLVFSSTLAPEERKLIAAFVGQNNHIGGGGALERTLPPGMRDLSPMALSEIDDESKCSRDVCDEKEVQPENDFDAMINLEGYGYIGAVDESGIFAEMNLAWLNGMDVDNGEGQALGLHQGPERLSHGHEENGGGDNNDESSSKASDGSDKQEDLLLLALGKDEGGLDENILEVAGSLDNGHQG
ncbi:hypothetical protein DV736_g5562, partial [Chaetothyriales sp. CBS 134916]